MKTLLSVLLALAVTVLTLLYAFWQVDWHALGKVLASSNWLMLLPFAGLLVLYFLFTGLRWALILRPLGRFSLLQVTPAMMIGFGGNNILPAHLGELVRTVVFARANALSLGGVFTTLLLERFFDVLAILAFYTAAVQMIHPFPQSIRLGSQAVAWIMAAAVLGLVAFLRYPAAFVTLWDRLSRPLPERLRALGHRQLAHVAAGLSSVKSPRLLLPMLAYSLLKWLASGALVWVSLHAFGQEIDLGVSMIVVAITALAVTVPSTPGFFGVLQAAFVFALTPFGVSREVALAGSLFFQFAQWFPITLAGVLCFVAAAPSLREVRAGMAEIQKHG